MHDMLAYDRVSLRHDGASEDTVGPVSLTLRRGERVLLLGPSGAGKSTLLHAATGLFPGSIPGTRKGDIRLNERPVESRQPSDWADTCGYLFQDAAQTLAGFSVRDEVAFGPENLGVPALHLPALVTKSLESAGIPGDWADRRVSTLSGGERQCVALAALLAQSAPITLADEPAASLAPMAAERMSELLLAAGRTTLIVDHKPGRILSRIDRCVALSDGGRILTDGTAIDVLTRDADVLAKAGISLPLGIRLHLAFPEIVRPTLRVVDALRQLQRKHSETLRGAILPEPASRGKTLVTLDEAECAPPFGPVILRNVSLAMRSGEVLAILGPNGAGKTTLAGCLAGLVPLRAGSRQGPPGAVAFQNPEAHFSRDSVRAEISALGQETDPIAPILGRWGLSQVANQHPFTLSQGQKRRLSLALLSECDRWPLLILDEPTAGLDGTAEAELARRIRTLAQAGRSIAVITHDLDFALAVADRALLVGKGTLLFDGSCSELMRDTAGLTEIGLLPPEAAPVLEWLEA